MTISFRQELQWLVRTIVLFLWVFCFILLIQGMMRSTLEAPNPSLWLDDRNGQYIGEIAGKSLETKGFWPVGRIPDRVAAATLAIEDRRFYWHEGIDPVAVARALFQNVTQFRRVSGASTIAMQVARMQNQAPRTFSNKIVEMITARWMVLRYGHDAVLKHYLKIVPYGNQIHGIGLAARSYFDKPVDDLSWAEVALLTAIPQAPGRMNPYSMKSRVQAIDRGGRILDELKSRHLLSDSEYQTAGIQLKSIAVPAKPSRPVTSIHALFRIEESIRNSTAGYGSGYQRSTIDLDLQSDISDILINMGSRWYDRGVGNMAVMVVDLASGEVLGYAGSMDYYDKIHSGSINFARVPRSSGSTLKPFIFALALEKGVITPGTILDDIYRGVSGITNSDESFLGPMLPRFALANSRNVPAVNLTARTGIDEVYYYFSRLGLHSNQRPAGYYGLGMAIGGLPVTLEQLITAYSTLAGNGSLRPLRWYENQSMEHPRRIMSRGTAQLITRFLSDPSARLPTFTRMGSTEYPYPVAVKTGTSSGTRDEWAMVYSDQYMTGVWVGHPDHKPMQPGNRFAAELARTIMTILHDNRTDGMSDRGFQAPDQYIPVKICCISGKCATTACTQVVEEYFPPGSEPHEICDVHVRIPFDVRTGIQVDAISDASYETFRTVLNPPPKYAIWAHMRNYETLAGYAGRSKLLSGEKSPKVDILYPENHMMVTPDPEAAFQTLLPLKAIVDPPVQSIIWMVNGIPFKSVGYPYDTVWPIVKGRHVFQVLAPDSQTVSIPVGIEVF